MVNSCCSEMPCFLCPWYFLQSFKRSHADQMGFQEILVHGNKVLVLSTTWWTMLVYTIITCLQTRKNDLHIERPVCLFASTSFVNAAVFYKNSDYWETNWQSLVLNRLNFEKALPNISVWHDFFSTVFLKSFFRVDCFPCLRKIVKNY